MKLRVKRLSGDSTFRHFSQLRNSLLMGVLMMIFSRGRCMSSFNPQMVRKQTTQDYTLYVPNPHSAPFTSRLKYVLVYLGTAFNLLNFFM